MHRVHPSSVEIWLKGNQESWNGKYWVLNPPTAHNMKRPHFDSSTPPVKRPHRDSSSNTSVDQLKKVRMRTRRNKKTRRVVLDGPATPENPKWTTVYKNEIFESRYRVEEVLGSGSQGVVCRATDLMDNNAEVAIKWIRLSMKGDAVRMLREIRIMKVLGVHSDVLRLKRVMMSKDMKHVLLVMDLMEADLRTVLDLNTLQSIHRRVFMYQLVRGLAFMHDSGVLHRDLKPQNILVNGDCTVRIADFGISRYGFDQEHASSGTNTSTSDPDSQWTEYVVTRWYRAPELCGLFYKAYGAAVDMWSIGCIFAEMLIGSPLFLGRDSEDQLKVITDLLGKPSDACIRKIENPLARKWLQDLPPKPNKLIQTLVELGVHDKHALDLLTKLLAFDPEQRLSARDAMSHPYLQNIHDIIRERDWTHEAALAKECFRRLREPSVDQAADTLRSEFGGSQTCDFFDEERHLRAQIELLESKKSRASARATTDHLTPATRTQKQ